MPLVSGARLGPYEILAPLGAGGMGEIYHASDTRLGRVVAIKLLPAHVADSPTRRQRFEIEARAVSTLSHPHICTLFDIGEHDGLPFLVMEYLEGETLAARLIRGALPINDVLRHAIEIADALDHAHRLRIVHRDLKPANIMLMRTGVKLLDFGVAKLLEPDAIAARPKPGAPPHDTITEEGTIVGTLQYMAPEQVEGKDVDARADVFAFGAIVYEMITGRRVFTGGSPASVTAAILTTDPPLMATDEPLTPPALERVVKKCLARNRDARWQTACDLVDELKWIAEGGSPIKDAHGRPFEFTQGGPVDVAQGPHATARKRARRMQLATAASTLMLGAGLAAAAMWTVRRSAPMPPQPIRFTVAPPPDLILATPSNDRDVAISPDGTRLVYAIAGTGARSGLHVRTMDQLQSVPLGGTTGARWPFVSSDSRWIGFQIRSGAVSALLKKVSMTGGPPITVCEIQGTLMGASWGADDTIVFATNVRTTGLLSVSAAGDTPTVLTEPDPRQGELDHTLPFVLPGGRAVLFTIVAHGDVLENSRIAVLDLETRQRKTLVRGGSHAEFVAPSAGSGPGYLVYATGDTLRAMRFDPARLEIVGDPVPVVEQLLTKRNGTAAFSVSHTGTLVYRAGGLATRADDERTLVWVDRQGREGAIKAPSREYVYPRLSPDGTRIAVDVRGEERHIWIWDPAHESLARLTVDPELDGSPVWTPDGKRVIFYSDRSGHQELYVRQADGGGGLQQLTKGLPPLAPSSITPDGKQLVAMDYSRAAGDVTLVHLDNPARTAPLIQTPFEEGNAEISPDGRWLAYQSNELGESEVYVRPFPNVEAGRWQVSSGAGQHPLWARTGRELFYIDARRPALMSVAVQTGSSFSSASPVKMFDAAPYLTYGAGRSYDVSPDGRKFLMIKNAATPEPSEQAPAPMTVVINWIEELKQRVPVK